MRVIHATEEQLSNQQCIQNMVLSSLDELKRRRDMNQYYKGNNLEIQKKEAKEDSFITSNNKIRTEEEFVCICRIKLQMYYLK